MRRAPLLALAFALALGLAAAVPTGAATQSRTTTPVRMKAPSPANASVAGFKLSLVRVHGKRQGSPSAARAVARAAAGPPKNVTVYAVLAKQKRSDRVSGVLVAANRASAVSTTSTRAAVRRFTVNLKHAAVPRGYRLALKLAEADNVLGRHRVLLCSSYFKQSDLAGAQRLSGPRLPNITIGTVIQSACSSARSRNPYPTLGEFRSALNAPSGALVFTQSTQSPSEVDGTASFNYPVKAFGVVADSGHQLTSCAFAGGTCAIGSNPSALFTLSAPAAAGTQLAFSLTVSPGVTPALPFQFFGVDQAGHRLGPLLTSGP